jgi:hypothetical protein
LFALKALLNLSNNVKGGTFLADATRAKKHGSRAACDVVDRVVAETPHIASKRFGYDLWNR